MAKSSISHKLRRLTRVVADSFPILRFSIHEHSMEPTLRPGDEVLAWRWWRPEAGNIVIAQHHGAHIVKRVESVRDGQYWLLGDNPRRSIDSRRFGPVTGREIIAVVWHKRARFDRN